MQQELLNLLSARQGHFRYESGYHGDMWLDLDLLFLRPRAVQPFAIELAYRLARHNIEAVCGPMIGGALVAQIIATTLDIEFYYTERFVRPNDAGLYPVEYRLPQSLGPVVRTKNVAIVDDVISAGSAMRGTLVDLQSWGVGSVVVGGLLVLGDAARTFFAGQNVPMECIVQRPSNLWKPEDCPLCQSQVPLEDPTTDANRFPKTQTPPP